MRNEKVYTKCKSEKIPKEIQHSVIDIKMDLLVKVIDEFKL